MDADAYHRLDEAIAAAQEEVAILTRKRNDLVLADARRRREAETRRAEDEARAPAVYVILETTWKWPECGCVAFTTRELAQQCLANTPRDVDTTREIRRVLLDVKTCMDSNE